jgi:predicted DNA-binding transcriptional regulator YafY
MSHNIAYNYPMPRKPENLETLHISLELLKRIPRQRKISARELHAQLTEAGFERDLRSIQRQLESLCQHFEIECDDSSRPYGYRWREGAAGLSLPGLTEQESLLLSLAEHNLRNQLPAALMKSLQGFFEQARRNLSLANVDATAARAREWLGKVRVVSATLPMLPPRVLPGVFEQVSQALYNNCWLEISYTNVEGKHTEAKVMPLGLAQQGVRLFMPCRFDGYKDIRNLVLHRIQKATCTTLRFTRPADFDLAAYDDNGRFAFGEGTKVHVHLWISEHHAVLLAESPLATDQRITRSKRKEGGHELHATVTDSSLLIWWIRSQGISVRVLSPQELVDAVKS